MYLQQNNDEKKCVKKSLLFLGYRIVLSSKKRKKNEFSLIYTYTKKKIRLRLTMPNNHAYLLSWWQFSTVHLQPFAVPRFPVFMLLTTTVVGHSGIVARKRAKLLWNITYGQWLPEWSAAQLWTKRKKTCFFSKKKIYIQCQGQTVCIKKLQKTRQKESVREYDDFVKRGKKHWFAVPQCPGKNAFPFTTKYIYSPEKFGQQPLFCFSEQGPKWRVGTSKSFLQAFDRDGFQLKYLHFKIRFTYKMVKFFIFMRSDLLFCFLFFFVCCLFCRHNFGGVFLGLSEAKSFIHHLVLECMIVAIHLKKMFWS